MTRHLSIAAFLLGAIIVLWMGASFIRNNPLALLVTLVIAAVYAAGFAELWLYQRATTTLDQALAASGERVSELDSWLARLHPSLHNSVRLRIEGEHLGLPAPVLTPYLVGLLVMLGLLGTFVGMVETLEGAVTALEGSTELAAIRAGLAAPMKGLGMAFGTSVAGVAASAMLGFISTLSRRERMLASRRLDDRIKTVFRDFSLAWNRQQTYQAMQQQADALPKVADQLTTLAGELGQLGERIARQLGDNQQQFHQQAQQQLQQLADDVGSALKQALADSGRLAGDSIQPAVNRLVDELRDQASATHRQLGDTTREQLAALGERFAGVSNDVSRQWQQAASGWQQQQQALLDGLQQQLGDVTRQLQHHHQQQQQQLADSDSQRLALWSERFADAQQQAATLLQQAGQQLAERLDDSGRQLSQQQQAGIDALQQTATTIAASQQQQAGAVLDNIERLMQASENLVNARITSEQRWLDEANGRIELLAGGISEQLAGLRTDEAARAEAAEQRLAQLHHDMAGQLASLGQALETPMTRLIETASAAPQAAAEVIAQLRAEISKNLARDNELLEERQRIMQQLSALSTSMEQAATAQRQAMEHMVSASAGMLQQVADGFAGDIDKRSSQLGDMVELFSASAAELAALGDSFTSAVAQFGDSNQQMMTQLGEIGSALQQAGERSDEQLGYYVAQAREIIDHNLLAQQEILDTLRRLGRDSMASGAGA